MKTDNEKFPENFILGTATSAFQIEGEGKTEWSGFTGADGTPLGKAIDHYARYKEDLEYILYLGNAYRFSPDWSRLQEGPFLELDPEALSHYMKIFNALKDNKKKVLIVFNHFANPLWFIKEGGWSNSRSVNYFLDFVKKMLSVFSDYIDIINTFNEPNAYINLVYLLRQFPPRKFNPFLRKMSLLNMVKAHSLIYEHVKERYPEIPVGISHANILIELKNPKSLKDVFIKKFFDTVMNENVHEYFTKNASGLDYIGFSYYGRILLEKFPLAAYEDRGRKRLDELEIEHDDMWELYPEGIYRTLKFFYEKYKKPLLITENGTCTDNDELRKHNLYNHLKFIKKACDEGLPVMGYFHWSTFDNFELAHGPSRRFGLTAVDFKSPGLERKIKPSGHYYHKIVESNSLINPCLII